MESHTVWISVLYNRLDVCSHCNRIGSFYTSDSSLRSHATAQLNMLSYFSADSTIFYKNVISGVTVWPKLPLRTVFKYLITERTWRKKPQQVIRANIARLCIEWNKCEAIPYFWSYFLITLQRMDFVVVSPMDLLHLFHWPRLLQLNVHQFVRISWLSFFPFPIIRTLFFFPLSLSVFLLPDWVDVQLCDYNFSGVRDFLFFNVTSLYVSLDAHEPFGPMFLFVTVERGYDGIAVDSTASNETLYVFICSLFPFSHLLWK